MINVMLVWTCNEKMQGSVVNCQTSTNTIPINLQTGYTNAFCTEHDNHTVRFCTKFQNDSATDLASTIKANENSRDFSVRQIVDKKATTQYIT